MRMTMTMGLMIVAAMVVVVRVSVGHFIWFAGCMLAGCCSM